MLGLVARGAVWVANAIDNTISRLDPASGDMVATITLDAIPEDIRRRRRRRPTSGLR
jgi:streptogramin lyase